jgi:hypothetical protein
MSFKPVGAAAVNVLAKLAAKRAVREELREQGVRVTLVKPADLSAATAKYLDQHPELYLDALKLAHRLGLLPVS